MHASFRLAALAAAAALSSVTAMAQTTRTAEGHWEGTMKAAGQDFPITVDLSKSPNGEWAGAFGIPDAGITDVPLSKLAVVGPAVRFEVTGIPGAPTFEGTLNADGNISGTFTADRKPAPLSLKRTGAARMLRPASVSRAFEGTWKGSLKLNDTTRHFVMKLSHAADGSATGTLTDADQGNRESPLTGIVQTGNALQFEVKTLSGTYRGILNESAKEIRGQWLQNGKSALLIFSPGTPNSPLSKAFQGTWQGEIDAGPGYKITLILKLGRASDGSATGTITNTETQAREVPLNSIVERDKAIEFTVSVLQASFHGTIDGAGTAISGSWTQEQLVENLPLTFKRRAPAAK